MGDIVSGHGVPHTSPAASSPFRLRLSAREGDSPFTHDTAPDAAAARWDEAERWEHAGDGGAEPVAVAVAGAAGRAQGACSRGGETCLGGECTHVSVGVEAGWSCAGAPSGPSLARDPCRADLGRGDGGLRCWLDALCSSCCCCALGGAHTNF